MAEAFPDYWRVREEIYRSIAASGSSGSDQAVWMNLAEGCAKQAAAVEQAAGNDERS